jgi:hypothetical protein
MSEPVVLINSFEVAAAGLAGYRAHPALYRPART